ncbi:unnamed protein product [Rhizoctonia solani]|uniref:Uncharacterized protein n=1 Tax=Rhizoctonia solani TaxID=456999 RepID=A0A8H2WZJ6_9AGAM|nr:unnamed protein product [Rhizoctonia solani]
MSGTSPPGFKSRAPVINPFDKLNQRQFDSYVSSIQAKIKVALDPPSPEPQHVSRTFAEISRSTIASPAPSPAPLSRRSGQNTRPSSRATLTPLGAGTPSEPYELSDDDDESAKGTRSRSQSEALYEEEPEPLGSIQEENEDNQFESDNERQGPEHNLHGQEPDDEGAWDYSGEDASEQDELSETDQIDEVEEEDVFVGKGKGRHPAEGPGLAGLLNGSSAYRTSIAPGSPERMSDSISPDNSFEAGVAQIPTMGVTSTPFTSRFATRGSARNMEEIIDNEDAGSPPWEGDQSSLIPLDQNAHEDEDEGEELGEATSAAGTGHDTAIEVLDSDEDDASDGGLEMKTDGHRSGSRTPGNLYAGLGGGAYPELDELQFDDSAAFPHRTFEPDSLLDDTMDIHHSIMSGAVLPKPSSLFTGSSAARTREPSESRDAEESADTAHAPDYVVEEPGADTKTPSTRGEELEMDQASIQQSMDYSDFIGEKSLLAYQLDNSLSRTQAEENLLEVTVYELENGSRYYDYDGIRHFLNPEGEVYETCPIPPPRPTIQRPPDLTVIEEVTEYDMTRKMIGHDAQDEDEIPGRFNFLEGLDDTMSSVGGPILRYPHEDNSNISFNTEDIPQRPGAAMGFRARIVRGADGSAILSESLVLGDSTYESLPTERANPLSRNHSLEESMTGRNAGDLISEADDLISEDTFAHVDDDSADSILDDDDDSRDRSGTSTLANREGLTTPVPNPPAQAPDNQITDEMMDISGVQELPELDEKGVADALAAVAQLAQASSFENIGAINEVPETDVSMLAASEYDAFNQAEGLDRLIDTTTNMTAAEEDILARSFGVVDALQDATVPSTEVDEIVETVMPRLDIDQGAVVQSSVLDEIVHNPFIDPPSTSSEKLASEVLAEVFEGIDPVALPSRVATGTVTPMESPFQELEPTSRIEEVEINERSRASTPKPTGNTTMEVQESSPRRTPPTPTLSVGQSLTAPEMSIATSISGFQPSVSIYDGSPSSSINRDDMAPTIPLEPEVTQLPDPTLPPAPTHLTTPLVSNAVPESSETRRDLSPSVVVEPPTPHTRSEDGVEPGAPTVTTTIEPEVTASAQPARDSDLEDAASVDELLSDGENTATARSQNQVEISVDTPGRVSETQSTPTPEKRRMVFDGVELPVPRLSPRSSYITPNRLISESIISPVSDAAPPGFSPTPLKYQSLYKRVPTSGPFKAASEAGSARKSSGSDQGGPAPWPLRNLTHRHTRPEGSATCSPMTRSNCRYHKISIPMDNDDGTRVMFIVPACTLHDEKAMKEQGIEDCGLSAPEEEHTRITNLAKAEPSVVEKLQALVGTPIFQEGVCGYLEPYLAPKASRSSPRNKSSRLSEGRSSAEPKGSEKEGRARSPRTKPKSRSRPSSRHDNRAYRPPAEDSDSDDSVEDEPTRKRLKRRGTGGTASSIKFPTFAADSPQKPSEPLTTGPVSISKRMKRARRPADAQPFKPDPKDQESSTDTEMGRSPRKRTKRQSSNVSRRPNVLTETRSQEISDESINPFKPTHELKRLLSPPPNQTEPQSSNSIASRLSDTEQRELERHIALGDKPGEVVDESGDHVDTDTLEPAPAMAAAHVDRSAHNETGQRESSSKEDNASTSGTTKSKKPWHRFLRF